MYDDVPSSLLVSLFDFFKHLAVRLWPWFYSRRVPLAVSLAVGLLLYAVYAAYLDRNTCRVEFFVGQLGGKSDVDARKIRDLIHERQGFIGPRAQVELKYTEGYKDNYSYVEGDVDGTRVGFTYDGIQAFRDGVDHSDRVRILLPLQWSYLHIMARKDLVQTLSSLTPQAPVAPKAPSADGARSTQDDDRQEGTRAERGAEVTQTQQFKYLADLLLKVKDALPDRRRFGGDGYPKFYLGQRNSATRHVARLILAHHGIDPDYYEDTTVRDYDDMRARLSKGTLQIAFYSGPVGAATIKRIATDGQCELVGLEDTTQAIARERSQVGVGTIPAHSYIANGFCDGQVKTLLSRKLLVGSSSMARDVAFIVAAASNEVLEDDVNWNTDYNADAPQQRVTDDFHFETSPVFDLIKNEETPWKMPGWLQAALSVMGVWFGTEVLRVLRQLASLPSHSDPARTTTQEPPTDESPSYRELSDEVTHLVEHWVKHPQLTLQEFKPKLDALKQSIEAASEVTPHEATTLRASHADLTALVEMRQHHPPTSPASAPTSDE